MYSQYNQYQQPGGGSAVTTTTQPGLTWNGTAWVPATTPTTTTSAHSSYSTANSTNKPAAELVQTYTQYYHLWKAQEQEQERLAQSLPEGAAKETHKRQAQWYKHYADQSSIAAHHYHNTPHSAPPSLPPVPPGAAGGGTEATAPAGQPQQHVIQPVAAPVQAQAVIQQQQQKQHPLESPDGLKRYVHRCLQQCQGQDELQRMQKEVENVIAQAIRDGTMHSTNWDAKPLLPVDTATAVQASGGTAAAIKKFKQQNHQSTPQSNTSGNYYGPSSSGGGSNQGTNYYGPSSSSSRDQVGHYGPSSSNSVSTPAYGTPSAQSSSAGASYYGPSSTSTTSNSDYYGNSSEDKHKNKWKLQDKFPTSKTPSDFVSSDNYYGNNSKADLDDEDFVSLSSHKISRKRKKEKKKASNKKIKVKKEVFMQTPQDGLDRSSSALAKRANRFAGAGGISEAASLPTSTSKNMGRFMGLALIGGSKKLDEEDYEHMKVKGTCTKLEKDYLRLTAPPKAELVRPEVILRKHLKNLKTEWASSKHRDYIWFCSQLKAVRQDATVQQIANAFTVDVYETHARIALEEDDLNEYNQCQTQLKELYKTLQADREAIKNENEFVSYRLIYYVFLQGNKKYEGGSSDMFNIMLSLSPEQRQDSFISHALKVRVAVAEYDYHAFFRLLKDCSKHCTYLMSKMVPKVRHSALQRICKVYRPSVSTNHVLQELGFDVEKEADFGKKWLSSCGVVLSESGEEVLTKDSVVRESDLTEKASSLI